MRRVRQIFLGAAALAVGAPALGALLQGVWPAALGLLAIGALWFNAQRWRWLGALSFVLCVAGIALTVWMEVGIGWQLVGVTAALAAWDLDAFGVRLASAERIENERDLVRAHLRRLSAVCASGLLLGAAGTLIRVRLSFGPALLLALLAVLGLGHVLRNINETGAAP